MDMQSPPAYVQIAQAEVEPREAVEPQPVEIDVSKYAPTTAIGATMIVTLTPPTGSAVIYAPGNENDPILFKGPRSINEVSLNGPVLLIKLYDATSFNIQYVNFRQR